VEKAKNLLQNPASKISMVAFASGFRSLSQFNRVFKKGIRVQAFCRRRLDPAQFVRPVGIVTVGFSASQ
jgi:AraC-like DNA-binding protein